MKENEETDDRRLRYTPSESQTTNIPPRLPVGYSYASDDETQTTDVPEPEEHPDLATGGMTEEAERPQAEKYRSHRRRHRRRGLRRALWTLFTLIVLGGAAFGGFVLFQQKAAEPLPVATPKPAPRPKPKVALPEPIDTLLRDSLRQDSINKAYHEYHLYLKRKAEREAARRAAEEKATETPTPVEHHDSVNGHK